MLHVVKGKTLFSALLLVILLSTALAAEGSSATTSGFAAGMRVAASPFGGLSTKFVLFDKLVLQPTVFVNANNYRMEASLGTRVAASLGRKGNVFRYAGLGLSTGYRERSDGSDVTWGAEAFIGVDFPLSWWGVETPFSVSCDIGLISVFGKEQRNIDTGFSLGVFYWF